MVLLVMLVTAAKIFAVKVGTSIHPAHLPCQPTSLLCVLVKVDSLQTEMSSAIYFSEMSIHNSLKQLLALNIKRRPTIRMVYPLALSLEGLIKVNHETIIVLSVGLDVGGFVFYNSKSVL